MKILKLILINLVLLVISFSLAIDLSNTMYVENIKSGVGIVIQSFVMTLIATIFLIVFFSSSTAFKLSKNEILDKLNSMKKTEFNNLAFMFLYIYILMAFVYVLVFLGLIEIEKDKLSIDIFLNFFFGVVSFFLIYKNFLTKITIKYLLKII